MRVVQETRCCRADKVTARTTPRKVADSVGIESHFWRMGGGDTTLRELRSEVRGQRPELRGQSSEARTADGGASRRSSLWNRQTDEYTGEWRFEDG
jgi:hypothetical protein